MRGGARVRHAGGNRLVDRGVVTACSGPSLPLISTPSHTATLPHSSTILQSHSLTPHCFSFPRPPSSECNLLSTPSLLQPLILHAPHHALALLRAPSAAGGVLSNASLIACQLRLQPADRVQTKSVLLNPTQPSTPTDAVSGSLTVNIASLRSFRTHPPTLQLSQHPHDCPIEPLKTHAAHDPNNHGHPPTACQSTPDMQVHGRTPRHASEWQGARAR